MPFHFKMERKDVVIDVSGTLTFHQHQEAEQLVYQVSTILEKGGINKVRLNFANTERMDSHWLGVLIRIMRRVKEKGAEMVIEKPSEDVTRLFELVELNRIAQIVH